MPNPATTLIFRSNYDIATEYLSTYMQRVVDRAKTLGYTVVDLLGADATQTNFMNALQSNDPLLVIAAGHGNETGFYGQNDEQILAACTNDDVMTGRQGIFHSCSVGVSLGPSMVDKTAQWFAGWRADYVFLYDEMAPSPLEDNYAKPFMECIIQPALTRVEGGAPSQVYNETVNLFNYWIAQWWNSPDPMASDVITYLIHDRDNFMVTGVYVPLARLTLTPVLLAGGLGLFLLFQPKSL